MKTTRPLFDITADELMSTEVMSIPRRMSLGAAAYLLHRDQISGAPVVDEGGRCVGVLSARDFLRWAAEHAPVTASAHAGVATAGPEEALCASGEGNCPITVSTPPAAAHDQPESVFNEWQQEEDEPHDPVAAYMTADVVTANRSTPLSELARMMVDAHIHRLIITDDAHRPVGVVTSTDILAALIAEKARAAAPRFGPPD